MEDTTSSSGKKNNLYALLASLIWGTAFVAQKVNTIGAFTFTGVRSIIAVIFLLGLILIFNKGNGKMLLREASPEKTKELWTGGISCGLVLVLAAYCQQKSMDLGSEAGKVGFLTAFYMVLVPIFGIFMNKRVPWFHWISVLIAMAGLYFLCFSSGFTVRFSDMLAFLCSVLFTVHIMVIDHFSPLVDNVKLSCIQFLVVSVVSMFLGLMFEPFSLPELMNNVLPLLFLGIFSSGIAYTLQIYAQKGGNPAVVSILLSLESAFSVLASALILGEILKPREYIGCVLMMLAVISTQFTDRLSLFFTKRKKTDKG